MYNLIKNNKNNTNNNNENEMVCFSKEKPVHKYTVKMAVKNLNRTNFITFSTFYKQSKLCVCVFFYLFYLS